MKNFFDGLITNVSRIWQQTYKKKLVLDTSNKPIVTAFNLEKDKFVVLPLEVNGHVIGNWVFLWDSDEIGEALEAQDILKLASNILSSSIENQIKEEELRKAKNEAEQASRVKSDFLSVMSHEIRTPLNAVIGISFILQDENKDPLLSTTINTLNNSAENLLVLVNDILDYSKIEAGKLELHEQYFSPANLITSLIEENQYRIKENHQIVLSMSGDENNGIYLGDRMRIGQIINNLITNAIKFTEKGSIQVGIKSIAKKNGYETLRISIHDTGMGIDAAFLPQLFEKFTQATGSSTRKYGGTGLGLAICQSLLTLMDSKLEVESILHEGSTFWFDLDLKKTSSVEEIQPNTPVDKEESIEGMRVLLVEDNAINVFVCQNFLTKWGVISAVAVNGEESIQMAKDEIYDCILMDIQMPVMDGYEATSIIRQFNSTIPIIALSASPLMEKKEQSLLAGMNDFISKPFRSNELYSMLLKYKLNSEKS